MKSLLLLLRRHTAILLAFVLNFALTNDLHAQVCTGDITLSSQAEVDAFNCTEITGTLTISGSDITNLDALSGLSKVNSLRIIVNSALTSISGLSGLAEIVESLEIGDNIKLTNLDGFSGLTKIGNNLDIYENHVLTNLDGLSGLTKINDLGIYMNYALTNINGLSGVTKLNGLFIAENALTNIDGLSGITEMGGHLEIAYEHALTNLNGLSGVTHIGDDLRIEDIPGLANLDDLSGLTHVGNDLILHDTQFTNLDALSGLKGIGGRLIIISNNKLTNLDGLSGFTEVGSLWISNNGLLTNLDALSGLTHISNNIWILDEPSLTNLDALSGLTEIGGNLHIENNTSIISCCGLFPLLSSGGVAGTINISGNGAGCTETDIIANGPCSNICEGDITLSSQAEVDAFNCTEVTGRLAITGNDITNLDALSGLTKVNELFINDNKALTNLDGLLGLTSVVGLLVIAGNDELTSIDGLSGLKEVGSLHLIWNRRLSNLNGLSGLTHVDNDLEINALPALSNLDDLSGLTHVGNDLGLYFTKFTNLDALSGLTGIGGKLELQENYNLTNLDGLSEFTEVGSLSIRSNGLLKNLNALSGLTHISNNLWISDESSLTDLDALSGLTEIGGNLHIENNTSLISCCGLYSLLISSGVAGTIDISGNGVGCTEADIIANGPCANICEGDITLSSQAEVDACNCISIGGYLHIGREVLEGNESDITNLNSLSELKSVSGGLGIVYNPLLNDLRGLSGLSGKLGGINIALNGLKSLDGLEGITSVGGIEIIWNDALEDIDGLSNVTSVEWLNIDGNQNLIRCCGLYPLLSSGGVTGTINISNNGVGCTETDIIANGPCPGEEVLIVNAKGSEAGGGYAHFRVLVDGVEVGDAYTTSDYKAYAFALPNDPGSIKEVQIIFDNDAVIDGSDRNLWVQSIELNGAVMLVTEYGVTYITGEQIRDYQGIIPWSGILYFDIDDPEGKLIVNAKGSEAGGVYAHFKVLVRGEEIGDAYTTSDYKAYVFALPNDPRVIQEVRIVFDNDAVIDGSDRNLWVQSIELFGEVIPAPGDGVTYMTGDQMRDYRGIMPWGGTLYFDINVSGVPLIVNTAGSEAGGVYAHFRVLVDGVEIGDAYTTSSYEPYAFSLSIDPLTNHEICIVFDNDAVIDGHDRNLYVQSIELNGEVIPATGDNVTYDGRTYKGVMPWNGILYFGINNPQLIFWNTMDSQYDVENSKVGPDIIQTTYIFPLWGEAQIAPAKFGNGLFINHDTNEGWQNDGGNFFVLDNEAMGMLPTRGTIEFWMRFMYDCTFHNWAPMFIMKNELTGHYTYWPPDRPGTYLDLMWSGWDYGSFGKRYQITVGNGIDETNYNMCGTDYSTYPGGDLEFYTNELSHFAVVWDVDGIDGTDETMRLYVDGETAISLTDKWTSPGGILDYTYLGTYPNYGSRDHWYNAFYGVMDNLKIWNYSKTNFDDRFFEGFITCPESLTVQFDEDLSAENLGYPEVIVNCEGEINYDYNDVNIPGSTPNNYTMERLWTITDACGSQGTCSQIINVVDQIAIGHTDVYSNLTRGDTRRAIPVTMTVDGNIESVSMYHHGSTGNMILAVYADDDGSPGTRLGITPPTKVNATEGWQTINLICPVSVISGQQVWLAWVYEFMPVINYTIGTPGRAASDETWDGGMPTAFGASIQRDYVYSIYANVVETGASTRLASNTKIQVDKEQQIDLSIFPNPFEQGINIEFNVLANNSEVTLSIIDQQGRILNVIQKDGLEIGHNLIQLSRDEILGRNASAGLYLLRMDLADFNIHKRILLN